MPIVIKHMDARAAGVSERTWDKIKSSLKPLAGSSRLYSAAAVEKLLGLDPGTLVNRKRAVR